MNNDNLEHLQLQLHRTTDNITRLSRQLQEHQTTVTGLSREIQRIAQLIPLFKTHHDTYADTVRNYESNFWDTYYSLLHCGTLLHTLQPASISTDIKLFVFHS